MEFDLKRSLNQHKRNLLQYFATLNALIAASYLFQSKYFLKQNLEMTFTREIAHWGYFCVGLSPYWKIRGKYV